MGRMSRSEDDASPVWDWEVDTDEVYVTMPQAGFKPTEVGVTGFQLNVKWMLYLQATTAGY